MRTRSERLVVSQNVSRRRPGLRVVPWVVLALAIGLGVGWAAATVFAPPTPQAEESSATFVEVRTDTVGSSMQVAVAATWQTQPVARNRGAGVVTAVEVEYAEQVSAGQVLYRVDERPVVAAAGDVPAYRDMTAGSSGRDVAQLQQFLASSGYGRVPLTGQWRASTTQAVRAWQRALGVVDDGVVRASDLLFVPSLPARVVLDPAVVVRGAVLVGDEDAIAVLSAVPRFEVSLTDDQVLRTAPGDRVDLTYGGSAWQGQVATYATDASGAQVAVLEGVNGSALCAEQCAQVPAAGRTLMQGTLILAPEVTGLMVPAAALMTAADGSVEVLSQGGERVAVQVVAEARGLVIVTGVAEGTLVRVPADE